MSRYLVCMSTDEKTSSGLAREYLTLLESLQGGRISAADFRATVRDMRETYGDVTIDRAKFGAVAVLSR